MLLASKSVERAALSLECVDDIECCDGLSPGVFSVGHCISDHVFQEDLQYVAAFVVDESTDALDSSSASESADGRLGDALDVLAHNPPMSLLCAHFAESLASFSASDHFLRQVAGLLYLHRYPSALQSTL